MSTLHTGHLSNGFGAQDAHLNTGFVHNLDTSGDPVEAYFECISQCSLDDGECVTVCTTILREMS
jgi:hypothetical protein